MAGTFGGVDAEFDRILAASGSFDLWCRPLVSVSGPDAVSFLQGLLSQDVKSMADHTWRWSFLLHPNGKVDSFLRVARLTGDGEFLLDTDPGYGPALCESLGRFLIRTKVTIAPVESRGLIRLAGSAAPEVLAAVGASEAPVAGAIVGAHPPGMAEEVLVLEAPYPCGGPPGRGGEVVAYDLLVSESSAVAVWKLLLEAGAAPCGWRCLEAFRVLAGHPALGAELDEKTIAQETGLEGVAVSFEKGCYLGQELVARIDSRGHVNRYLRRLRMRGQGRTSGDGTGGEVPPAGAEVYSGGKAVGRVTSSMRIPGMGPVCLAYVRREIQPGAGVVIGSDGSGGEATVEAVSPVP